MRSELASINVSDISILNKFILHTAEAIALLVIMGATSGCAGVSYKDDQGAIHHLIIGIGIVSTPKQDNTGVSVIKTEVIGIHTSNQPQFKFGAGYLGSSVIAIPMSTGNIVIEISQKPFGSLTVEANPLCGENK